MGPPKKKPPKLTYSEKLKQCDYFEHRYNPETEDYYFFNPYTGETIFCADFSMANRAVSMWAPRDNVIATNVAGVQLYPEFYLSRQWGRRKFDAPWSKGKRAAVTLINASVRGFLARRALSRYYGMRYAKILCEYSQYYYFYDRYDENPQADATWYKPRLAFPWDIGLWSPDDPEDYMRGDKYSYRGFEKGPYICKTGVNPKAKARAEQEAFIKQSDWRDNALEDPAHIDIEGETPLGSVIPWMDGLRVKPLVIDEYVVMRTAITNNNWSRVYAQMKRYPQNAQLQLYGMFCFASSRVPLESSGEGGMLMPEAVVVFEHMLDIISASNTTYSYTFKIFALNVLYNMMSTHAGRSEFFNTRHITLQGEGRQEAIERHQLNMLKKLLRYLENIPSEYKHSAVKGSSVVNMTCEPSHVGVDIVEATLLCLCVLAMEQDTREIMAEVCIDALMATMEKCHGEAQVIINGLRFMYNLCYRCESGAECIIQRKPKILTAAIRRSFGGDPDVNRALHRFELAIAENGWRGNVEEVIEREMRQDDQLSAAMRSVQSMSDDEFEALFAGSYSNNADEYSKAGGSVVSVKGGRPKTSASAGAGAGADAMYSPGDDSRPGSPGQPEPSNISGIGHSAYGEGSFAYGGDSEAK